MNITKKDIDSLNTVLTVEVDKQDYLPKVEKILKDYKRTATVPGFRKGYVPMGMIKKQYEKSVIIDEVNKLLQDALTKYLTDEKLDILGNPIPKPDENFTWDSEKFAFDFELGMAPKFNIDLDTKNKITLNSIVADKAFIDEEVLNIQKQYGKLISQTEVVEDGRIVGDFTFEYKGENQTKNATFDLDKIKGKVNQKKFLGKKIGDEIKLKTKGLFKDAHDLMHALGLDHDDAHGFDVPVSFKITEINKTELAELNQELFDKLFGEGKISSEKELREEIKNTAEKQFQNQADQQFLNAATDYLIENTKFDLPAEFLKKWLQIGTDKELTKEEAIAEYDRSEKGLRYQLIEGQIAKEHDLRVAYEDLRAYAGNVVSQQYMQYGMPKPSGEELKPIVDSVLQNQEESRRLSEQLMSQKLLDFYKENLKYKTKKVTYKEFVEETYK
jgi:trigger factor